MGQRRNQDRITSLYEQMLDASSEIKAFDMKDKLNNYLDIYKRSWTKQYFLKRKYWDRSKVIYPVIITISKFIGYIIVINHIMKGTMSVGDLVLIVTSEKIYISGNFPNEYTGSESRLALKGAVAKAKANAVQGIPELIQIAANREYSENMKRKHAKDAKYGWYRYDVRFALPVYDDRTGEICRYNIFFARMLVRHDADGKKYLYDLLAIKKETSSPLE